MNPEELYQYEYPEWLNEMKQEDSTWYRQPEDFNSSGHYE